MSFILMAKKLTNCLSGFFLCPVVHGIANAFGYGGMFTLFICFGWILKNFTYQHFPSHIAHPLLLCGWQWKSIASPLEIWHYIFIAMSCGAQTNRTLSFLVSTFPFRLLPFKWYTDCTICVQECNLETAFCWSADTRYFCSFWCGASTIMIAQISIALWLIVLGIWSYAAVQAVHRHTIHTQECNLDTAFGQVSWSTDTGYFCSYQCGVSFSCIKPCVHIECTVTSHCYVRFQRQQIYEVRTFDLCFYMCFSL